MKIISLELHGYKRIKLSGISTFKIRPTQDIQLILGTNGSGKSSILDELTPLPSNPHDYLKEGYSLKTITHNGHIYTLKSSFSPKTFHSFIKDGGDEMNQGGTVTVQKDLVRQEFGITTDIHELLMGRERFTEMSPGYRRQWLTNLSNTNYEYAIEVYSKLKERLRDVSGALKLSSTRLVTETAKLLSDDDQQRLKEDVERTHEYVQHLMEYRKPVEHNPDNLHKLFLQLEQEIVSKCKRYTEKILSLSALDDSYSYEQISDSISQLVGEENYFKHVLADLYSQFESIKESIVLLEKTGNQGTEELRRKIDALFQEQTGLMIKKVRFTNVHKDPLEAIRAIETIGEALGSIFVQIPSNSDKRFSKISLQESTEKLFSQRQTKEQIKNKINILSSKKQNQEAHKHVGEAECPKCKHRWFKGFDQLVYDSILVELDTLNEEFNLIEKQIKETETFIEEIHSYFSLYRQYLNYASNWPTLKDYWDYVEESNLLLTNPGNLISDLELFKVNLLIDKSYHILEAEIDKLKDLITISQQVGNLDLEKLTKQREEKEEQIYSANLKLSDISKNIRELTSYKRTLEEVKALQEEIEKLKRTFEETQKDSIETSRRTHLNNTIRIIQASLLRKEEQLVELRTQHAVVQELKSSIQSLQDDEICLKTLVREMSPTEGLIAEGLFGFIKLFVSQLNSFIKRIWTYQLEILPCELTQDGKVDLDYKFPMRIDGMTDNVSDISKGSTGMKEIINLAFKIRSMKYLGLSESPLCLDEFGAAMDSAHRTSSIEMMKHIADEEPFTQLFIVNHYDSIYGALTNAEICVLCSSNIDIPKNAVYNRHVEIS